MTILVAYCCYSSSRLCLNATCTDIVELDFLKGFKDRIQQLVLAGNPCADQPDPLLYNHAIVSRFPQIQLIDEKPAMVCRVLLCIRVAR